MNDEASEWMDRAEALLGARSIPTAQAAMVTDEQGMRLAFTPLGENFHDFERLVEAIRPTAAVITRLSVEGFFPTIALVGGVKDVLVTLLTDEDDADEDNNDDFAGPGASTGLGARLFLGGAVERSAAEFRIIRNSLEAAVHGLLGDPDEDDWEPVSEDETFQRLLVRAKLDNPENEQLLGDARRYDYRDIVLRVSQAKRSQHRAAWRRNADQLAQEVLSLDPSLAAANLTILRSAVYETLQGRDFYCATKEAGEPVVQAIMRARKPRRDRASEAAQDGLI